MITAETVKNIVAEKIAADGCFIVRLAVSADNEIELVVDSKKGIDIDYCTELVRLVEANLDRDKEDYALEVSSAGIGCVFEVPGQFEKNIGNEVEVTMPNGSWKKGTLLAFDADGFDIECEEKERPEGSNKKVAVKKQYRYNFNEVKQVKDIISFK